MNINHEIAVECARNTFLIDAIEEEKRKGGKKHTCCPSHEDEGFYAALS